MPDRLRIGFLSPHNPLDRRAFSGTAFHMHRALAAAPGLEVRVLGGHRRPGIGARIAERLSGPPRIDPAALDLSGLDAVLALTATGFADTLIQRGSAPLLHVTDATPAFLRTFYGRDVPREAEEREARVVRGAALTIYSSQFMADRAAAEFGADPGRLAAVPFGTNFDALPEAMPAKPPAPPLNLLWVGSNWERKGGAIALAAFEALRARGTDARLSLVGQVPKNLALPPGVERVGYLDKNRTGDARRLERLFAEAHLFVLPTRADCTPMVLAEANAHGTPVLVTDTGGIGSLVDEGASGRMLPMTAGPDEWAAAIGAMTEDPAAHAALCRSSFEHARTRLTWEAWARDVAALLKRAVPGD